MYLIFYLALDLADPKLKRCTKKCQGQSRLICLINFYLWRITEIRTIVGNVPE